jgi:hypothetical protein
MSCATAPSPGGGQKRKPLRRSTGSERTRCSTMPSRKVVRFSRPVDGHTTWTWWPVPVPVPTRVSVSVPVARAAARRCAKNEAPLTSGA